MDARNGSLLKRLSMAQLDVFFPSMKEEREGDRAEKGLELCTQWGIKTSRTAVHECYVRHYFGWALERAAFAAQQTGTMPEFEEEKRKLISQKLFAEVASVDCDPKLLVLIRSLEIEQEKIAQRERLAEGRAKLETQKLKLAERRVQVLEKKIEKAAAKLAELRDPKKADDSKTRQAILDHVDVLMGLKKS